MKKPPYTITNKINNYCSQISQLIGKYGGLTQPTPRLELRRQSQIFSIHSSLAIEGNTLTIKQVTDIINNKRVVGPKKDILEVKNAIKVYDHIDAFKPNSLSSLLEAHKILMKDLLPNPGKLRGQNVGVLSGDQVIHMAPKHVFVPQLMDDLFSFLNTETTLHPLIKSSVFHYEFEFIHPFMDGNGRMGRLWQSVMLYQYDQIFNYIPIETMINKRQSEYYEAIRESTHKGESTAFIQFILETIYEATTQFTKNIRPTKQSAQLRINAARQNFLKKTFRRKEYLSICPGISPQLATKDLALAVGQGLLIKSGDNINTKYRFKDT